MRRTFEAMGTIVSLDLDGPLPLEVLSAAETAVHGVDATFSLYRADSPLSRIAAGELRLEDAPEAVRDEYARAVGWREATSGWFTPHRPDGVLDLSGTVKAVALAAASDLLAAAGGVGMLGIGGDIALVGSAGPRVIGVVDPEDRSRVLTALRVDGSRRAVATSGSAERGDHIWSRLGVSDIRQATVVADDIVTADVLATAIVAAGSTHLDDLTARFDVDVLVVTGDGLLATPGLRLATRAAASA